MREAALSPVQVENFWGKVYVPADQDACWTYQGRRDRHVADIKGRRQHFEPRRVAWYSLRGPLKGRMRLYRRPTCSFRCVRPDHHRAVKLKSWPAVVSRATVRGRIRCRAGHRVAGDNVVYVKSVRRCRICWQERNCQQAREYARLERLRWRSTELRDDRRVDLADARL